MLTLRFLAYTSATAALLLTSACRVDFDGNDGGGQYQENFHANFKVDSGSRLSLDNENGSVEILAWDKNEVDVNATKYASSQSQLSDVKIESNATPTLVSIRTLRQHTIHGNSGARYTIRVPKHMILDRIHSTNGGINVEGVAAPVTLESTNGGLKFTRVDGRIEGRTTNGSIELSSCQGDSLLNSTNGRIEGDVDGGTVDAHTTNGDIELHIAHMDGKGPLRMITSNGRIDVTLDAGHDLRATTTNSSIRIHLPSTANADIHARTSHAKVTSDFETSRESEANQDEHGERHSLDSRIGSGGPLIDLNTSNGSIHIDKR
ncbi:MAG TPA: hypothetical protein VGL53_05800 [Bryobacteraceae bacterium]